MSSERGAQGRVVVGEQVRGGVIAVLSGSLDLTVADDIGDELRSAAGRTDPGPLVLDMAAVDFCDAAGLRALLVARAEGQRTGCRVVISPASPAMAWLLGLTGLATSFGYPPSESSG